MTTIYNFKRLWKNLLRSTFKYYNPDENFHISTFVKKIDGFLQPTSNHLANILISKVTVTIPKLPSLVLQATGYYILIRQIFHIYFHSFNVKE